MPKKCTQPLKRAFSPLYNLHKLFLTARAYASYENIVLTTFQLFPRLIRKLVNRQSKTPAYFRPHFEIVEFCLYQWGRDVDDRGVSVPQLFAKTDDKGIESGF